MEFVALPAFSDDIYVFIKYEYSIGSSWVECGISRVEEFLKSLGFSTIKQLEEFCSRVNVFEEFSHKTFLSEFINESDRQLLIQNASISNNFTLIPNLNRLTSLNDYLISYKKSDIIINSSKNPTYEDFFQVLFTWLTHGNNLERRNRFINWWNNPKESIPYSVLRNPKIKIPRDNGTPVLKIFKERVDHFLFDKEIKTESEKSVIEEGKTTPLIDIVHYLKNYILNWILTPSDWKYVSGTEINIGGTTPLKGVSVTIGGGGFGVFKDNSPKDISYLRFGQISASIGFGPSLPIIITVSPSVFPSAGTIYHGIGGRIRGKQSFQGNFVSYSITGANVANQTTTLMVIAPFSETEFPTLTGTKEQMQMELALFYLSIFKNSSAVICFDGMGAETSMSISASGSYGQIYSA